MIYLDNNATTILDPLVKKAMLKELDGPPSNPSSIHKYGQKAKKTLSQARTDIANILNVKPYELIFTSGGTEAINMCIYGFINNDYSSHIISSMIDHSCVFETINLMNKRGCEVSLLKSNEYGHITCEMIEEEIKDNTKLIVISAVNSETGVKNDISKIAKFAKERNIHLIVDGVALLGKNHFSIEDGISCMCFSAHKIHGPKGIGLAYIKSKMGFSSLINGGPQEFFKRAGTENLSGIIGLSESIKLAYNDMSKKISYIKNLRDTFESILQNNLEKIHINGKSERICNVSNIAFEGVDGESLLILLDQENIAASHGSACSAGAIEPSRILINMGIDKKLAKSSIRFSFSRFNTIEEIKKAAYIIIKIVSKLRSFKQ